MISYLKGNIKHKSDYLIVETQGVGYKVYVTIKILGKKKEDDEVELYTHQHIREDSSDLYGFSNIDELKFFEDLISVSGIGPKSGLAVISRFNIDDVKKSIVHEDTSLLTKVSGIGKKTAERLIVELKNKIDVPIKGEYQATMPTDDEAVDALLSLGYNKSQALEALEKVDKKASLEDKVKQALKNI